MSLGNSLKDLKDIILENFKNEQDEDRPVKWDINGVWTYLDRKIDVVQKEDKDILSSINSQNPNISPNQIKEEEVIMSIKNESLVEIFNNSIKKKKYLSQYSKMTSSQK
mmetsp:Transcript_8529/g.7550  ORF Transcript_8529/g.7550 Transcript_8529/m.7550 type:complete len:109 (+) Transcript_8529:362-688(+)